MKLLIRFVRWRRTSGGWVYFWLASCWAATTVTLGHLLSATWHAYLLSSVAFVLLFEVGVTYVLAAAWGSHRQLEAEGAALAAEKEAETETGA